MDTLFGTAFYESVQRDPLFAAEGMDLERAVCAMRLLRKRLREFEKLVAYGSLKLRLALYRYPLSRALYPLPFLDALIACERSRREFLAVPTGDAALRLLALWRRAAAAYRKSAAHHRALLDASLAADPVIGSKKIFYDKVGNRFELADVFRDADLLIANAALLEKEVAEREELLRDRERAFAPHLKPEAILANPSAEMSDLGRMMEELNTARHAEENILLERLGPYTIRLPHFDRGTPTDRQFFAYVLQNHEEGYPFVRVEPADRFYFLPLGDKAAFGWMGEQIFRAAIARGVPYWMQTGTRFYTMRDQQYWADVLTLADMQRRPHLDRDALMSQRSSMLDLLLMTCVEEIVNQIYNAKVRIHYGSSTYSFGPLVLAHSHLSIYFLPFNRSVWRMLERASFIGSGHADPSLAQYRTMEEVAQELSREDLAAMMQGGPLRVAAWRAEGII